MLYWTKEYLRTKLSVESYKWRHYINEINVKCDQVKNKQLNPQKYTIFDYTFEPELPARMLMPYRFMVILYPGTDRQKKKDSIFYNFMRNVMIKHLKSCKGIVKWFGQ